MGGGGGGGPFINRSPEELVRQVRDAEDKTAIKGFETQLGKLLANLLSTANSRDVELVRDRLESIKEDLGPPLERSIDLLYGGSVAKHTYVDGLSDIDSLLILNDSSLEKAKPSEALSRLASLIESTVGGQAKVFTGRLAVTVEYHDGMTIQLLPALRHGSSLKVPSFRHDGWSGISPKSFQEALAERNSECGGKLVPTIKLAKAALGLLPESQRLTGYHVESLAIAAFRNYKGAKTTAAMLPVFFEKSKDLVVRPILDRTGQSIHVDDYLGPPGSPQRIATSHILSRIGKRMRNASAHMSEDQWKALFRLRDE